MNRLLKISVPTFNICMSYQYGHSFIYVFDISISIWTTKEEVRNPLFNDWNVVLQIISFPDGQRKIDYKYYSMMLLFSYHD